MKIFFNKQNNQKIQEETTDLVTVATHKLKTFLTNNKWAIDYLINSGRGTMSPEQKELLEIVYTNNEQAIKMTRNLLLTNKNEGANLHVGKTKIDLLNLIKTTVGRLESVASKKSIKILVKADQDSSYKILGDEEKIGYVLENILDDSIIYTENGGSVSITIETQDDHVTISISDTGIGIPKSEQGGIFNKFFRATNGKKLSPEGTGLGLFISKHIVEKHGGSISFESEEGRGTTFQITLPIK